MPTSFIGGPRDGQDWEQPCLAPGRYWLNRTVRSGGVTIERSDLYEVRADAKGKLAWHFIETKAGYTSA